jgi:hypothetical protein
MKNRAKVKNLPTDYDTNSICTTQNCGKLQRKSVAIVTKTFGRDKIYNADAICGTQNHGKVRRNFFDIATLGPKKFISLQRTIVDIATLPLSLKKKKLNDKLDVWIHN